jgi:hypothetical protein
VGITSINEQRVGLLIAHALIEQHSLGFHLFTALPASDQHSR